MEKLGSTNWVNLSITLLFITVSLLLVDVSATVPGPFLCVVLSIPERYVANFSKICFLQLDA